MKYLAEYALAGSAFFMRVKDESKGFGALKRKLAGDYRAYSDKGRMSAKYKALSDKMKEVTQDLNLPARTQEQSIATAKKLFELADCALKVSVEDAMQQPAQEFSEDEKQSDEEVMTPLVGYG